MATCGVNKNPVNLAVTPHIQPLLAFNHEGFVDVFLFDDTSLIVEKLGLDKTKQLPLSTLANANILFHISQQLQLVPGETVEDDNQIIAHLKNCLSHNILNKDAVVKEICTAWNYVATLSMSTYYANLRESKTPAILGFQGAYELSLHNYIAGYLSTLSQYNQIQTWVFTQAAELVKSTIEGRAFSTNPFIKMLALTTLANECTADLQESKSTIDNINKRLEKEQSKWFTDIIGLVGFEVEQALEELSEAELKAKSGELQRTLQCLLDEITNNLSQDETICGLLEETFKLARAPLDHPVVLKSDPKPTQQQVLQAIAYVVAKNLREKKLTLASTSLTTDVNILKLASSKLDENVEKLLEMLLDENRYFTPTILNAIASRSASEAVRDVASSKLKAQESAEVLLTPAAATVTTLYEAKKQKKDETTAAPKPIGAPQVVIDIEDDSSSQKKAVVGKKRKSKV